MRDDVAARYRQRKLIEGTEPPRNLLQWPTGHPGSACPSHMLTRTALSKLSFRGIAKRPLNGHVSVAVPGSTLPTVKHRSLSMSKKDEYFAMMESQIKKWDAEVDKLGAK